MRIAIGRECERGVGALLQSLLTLADIAARVLKTNLRVRGAAASHTATVGRMNMAKRKSKSRSATRQASTAARQRSTSTRSSSAQRTSNARNDAVTLLKRDHREVSDLLERYERATGARKSGIVEQICRALTVHAQIEEDVFYPAAREALGDRDADLVNEADVEHASIKDLVSQLQSADASDEHYDARVKVLGEYVKHHVKEEESELFPKLRTTDLDLIELGRQLVARRAELTGASSPSANAGEEPEGAGRTSRRAGFGAAVARAAQRGRGD
jgi:hemerythrin superfamily protein